MILALVLASAMFYYVEGILIPYQQRDAAETGRPRGNLSDLYPRWLGARELLLRGRDPYSVEVTREIQSGYYGRPLDPRRPSDPTDQQGFAYPVFVVFLLAPTITLPFSTVQAGFYWLLLCFTVASVILWLKFLRWRPPGSLVFAMILLTAGSFPVVQGIKLQQLTLLVSGLIALAGALLVLGYQAPAGVLLALATIKPQLAAPIAGWLLVWSMGSGRERWRYVLAYALTLGVLLAGSEWILPGWIGRFSDAISAYRGYTGGGSLLDTLLGAFWGRLTALLIIGVVVMLCWKWRRVSSSEPPFLMITALVLTATVVIVPMIAPYNHVLLLPAVLMLVHKWPELHRGSVLVRTLTWGAVVLIGWPWFAAGALTVLSAVVRPDQVQRLWPLPLTTSLFIAPWLFALQLVSGLNAAIDAQQEPNQNHNRAGIDETEQADDERDLWYSRRRIAKGRLKVTKLD